MKKINMYKSISCALSVTAILALVGCGSDESASVQTENSNSSAIATASAEPGNTNAANNSGNKALIVYFSYSENTDLPENVDANARASIQQWNGQTTGNTGVVAHMIQKDIGGDLYSIKVANKYPADYDVAVNIGKQEVADKTRPELANHISNLNDYDTIFIGYPNWWGDMPMAMYTFFDEYDFSGKKIIPFNTSGGSQFSNTINEIKQLEPNATVEDNGLTVSSDNATNAQNEVDTWLKSIGYVK